jgi:Tfp pilus assembly protein PilP
VKASSVGPKPAVAQAKPAKVKVAVKPVARVKSAGRTKAAVTAAAGPKAAPSVQESKPAEIKKASEAVRAAGWRDPFVSPVIAMGATGSGCSAGKRCLTIDQIALKGVVKSESGMIAVVTNSLDKAYFLRENDPVFNGYVVKITGDSIIFKETFHDRLGKSLTRDVTKSITRPVA